MAKAYRGLLRAVNKHLGEEDAKRRFQEYVNQEFRSNSALLDPLDVRRKVMLAKDYTFLLNSVHHHKVMLFCIVLCGDVVHVNVNGCELGVVAGHNVVD